MSRPAPSLHHSGIDWLTVTASWDGSAEKLAECGFQLVKAFAGEGNKVRDASWQGYKGEIAGPIMCGHRGDGVILRASGEGAAYAFGVVQGLDVHPTRIDVQATVNYHERDMELLAARLKRDAMRARFLREGAPFKVRHIVGCGDGDAVLLGDRSSSAFGRSYDKYRETLQKYKEAVAVRRDIGFPDGTWRYEVEYKAEKAGKVYDRLKAAENLGEAIVADVKGWYADHGVKVPVEPIAKPAVKETPRVADVDKSLAWLKGSVAPTVAFVHEQGRLADVIEALGLGELLRGMELDELRKLLKCGPLELM